MADAATVDLEKVNVAEILNQEEAKQQVEEIATALEANPAAMKALNAVETVEDAYQMIKKIVKIKLEQFKVLFNKTVDYFKESKVALEDETLEYVAGGSLYSWFTEHKRAIVFGAFVVVGALCAFSFAIGTCGIGLAALAGCAGGIGGAVVGAIANELQYVADE